MNTLEKLLSVYQKDIFNNAEQSASLSGEDKGKRRKID